MSDHCCLCLLENDSLIDINGQYGTEVNIAHILVQRFWLDIVENDSSAQKICEHCWSTTDQFHKLYTKIQSLHNHLSQALVKNEFLNNFSDQNDCLKIETISNNEALSDDYVTPCTKISEDQADNTDNNSIPDDDVDVHSDAESLQIKLESQPRTRSNKIHKKKISRVAKTGKPAVDRKDKEELRQNKNRQDDQIREYFKMTCDICNKCFGSFLDATTHYKKHHQLQGYLTCCGRKFFRRCRVLDHIDRHLNPNAYKCALCNKTYVDKFALKYHMQNHIPAENRKYKCHICTNSFTNAYKLTKHLQLAHRSAEDRKFTCDDCGKSFLSKSVLTNHIKGVHELAFAKFCDICAKMFKSKQVFELHRMQHLNIETPKLQCNICGAWLKHEHSLRNHMVMHNETEKVCTICNKVTLNKQALNNHMRYVHSERSHKCTMCEKAFKKPIGLREHMASHTGEDLYTCTYCPKKFKSSANLHSHRKKAHPEEWERDRKYKLK